MILAMISVANADLTLTVNGLDTSMPVEVEPDDDIIIAVTGLTDEQKENYSATCEIGGKLTPLPEPNSPAEESREGDYLFTFEDEELGLAIVNLTVGEVLDYQLILFKVPDSNIIIFGMDSDTIEIPQPVPEPEPDTETEQIDIQFHYDYNNVVPYAQRKEQEKKESLKFCPGSSDSNETFSRAAYERWIEEHSEERQGDGFGLLMDGDPNIIEIYSDITTNQIWTADNIYYVTADIDVQALLVIEPGTTIYFSYYGSLFINNGGTLISIGTPDAPIIYTSDDPYGWGDYFSAIIVEHNASPATKIMYNYIENAFYAIITDNIRLDAPIENNYLFYNNIGIFEYGTHLTDVVNNLVFYCYNGYDHSVGIWIYLESQQGIGDANSHILIQNNTCDLQDDGIRVRGVPDINDAGTVLLINNIVSESWWYGLNLVNGNMYAVVANTGYYDNYMNKNWEFNEFYPVETNDFPYAFVEWPYDSHYLDQNCPFIDTGLGYIEETSLIGKTTDVNSMPDYNYVDIGFHYPNWYFSNPGNGDSLSADFDNSMKVDFKDFAVLASGWQTIYDINDLDILAGQWLQVADPNIEIHIYGDSNEGYVDIGISGYTSDTQQVFILADGKYVGEIFGFSEGYTFTIDISESGGQERQFKAVSIGNSGQIVCSNIKNIAFSCPLSYCLISSSYEPNQPLCFSALNGGEEDVSVEVYADCGNLVWSQIYDGNNILGSIPAGITGQHEIDYISFSPSGRSNGWSITKISDPAEPDVSFNVKALIILPDLRIRLNDFRSIWAVQDAFKNRGVKYRKLGGKSANRDIISWYATTNPIKYMYVDAHGQYQSGKNGVLRTRVKLSDGIAVSMKRSDFIDPNNAPSWCQKLDGNLEKTANSFLSMGLFSLEFAYFDCCWSGHLKINASNQLVEGQPDQIGLFDGPHSDMSLALGMGETSVSRAYQGWYGEVPTRLQLPLLETEYQKWVRLEWEELGDGESLYWALMHVISEQTEFGPYSPVKNYRLKGQGSPLDIELSN